MKKETFKLVMKSGVGAKLVPFFKTVSIYFVLFIPADEPSVFAAIIKALPVLSLIIFVLLHGMSLGNKHSYARRIILGLLFSVIGDVLLVWDHLFLHGLLAFLVAQIFYIASFGFTPINWKIGAVGYAATAVALAVLLPMVGAALSVGVLIYSVLLMTMMWRAAARAESLAQLYCSWSKFFSAIGGVVFVVSDTFLAFNHFYAPIPHAQVIVMSTYYAAQFAIALSVIDLDSSILDVVDTELVNNSLDTSTALDTSRTSDKTDEVMASDVNTEEDLAMFQPRLLVAAE